MSRASHVVMKVMQVMQGTLVVLGGLAALPGCPGADPLDPQCDVSADCGARELCVDRVCIIDETLPPGEGEGEGDPGEGEGEGDPGEGEGEGDPGEGEGEGDPGEGEGEGECAPACNEHQTCNAGSCSYTGDLCDTFNTAATLDYFTDITRTLDASTAEPFFHDSKERLWRNHRLTGARPGMQIEVTVTTQTSGYDPVLYLMDDSGGQCVQVAMNDDGAGLPNAKLTVDATGDDVDLAVTSFAALGATNSTGSYALKTRGVLCKDDNGGVALETVDQQTYDECFRVFEMFPQDCIDTNPCARNASGNLTGKFCCIQLGTTGNCGRTGNQPIFLTEFGDECGGVGAGGACAQTSECVSPLQCLSNTCR